MSDDRNAKHVLATAVFLQAAKGFAAIAVLLFVILMQVKVAAETAKQADVDSPGSVIVTISWPSDDVSDVDLWVRSPRDDAVGYSAKNGALFDLLRDDLGASGDITNLNYETAYTRGVVAGEYIVNVHLFSGKQTEFPIPVKAEVQVREKNGNVKTIVTGEVKLGDGKKEKTMFRFRLDDNGELVPGSISHIPIEIRRKR